MLLLESFLSQHWTGHSMPIPHAWIICFFTVVCFKVKILILVKKLFAAPDNISVLDSFPIFSSHSNPERDTSSTIPFRSASRLVLLLRLGTPSCNLPGLLLYHIQPYISLSPLPFPSILTHLWTALEKSLSFSSNCPQDMDPGLNPVLLLLSDLNSCLDLLCKQINMFLSAGKTTEIKDENQHHKYLRQYWKGPIVYTSVTQVVWGWYPLFNWRDVSRCLYATGVWRPSCRPTHLPSRQNRAETWDTQWYF